MGDLYIELETSNLFDVIYIGVRHIIETCLIIERALYCPDLLIRYNWIASSIDNR